MENKNENNYNLKKKKIILRQSLSGIIFARACCSIGIVIFHFFCHSKGEIKLLLLTANSSWGFMFVTAFFSISGTVLYYNYPKLYSKRSFYFKRWKSIFPPFYICFILFFIKNIFMHHKIFYNGHWIKLFWTLFGLDGYFIYRIKSYHLIGEWFLGAIIIIYILYPLLVWLMNKNILIIHCITSLFYLLMYYTNFFIIKKSRNIFTCINSFYFGMLGIKFYNLFFRNQATFIISFLLLVFLCLKRISNIILIFQIQGFLLFIVLVQIGKKIMKCRIKVLFIEISSLSYNIFLFHHKIILDILDIINPINWFLNILLLLIIIMITIIFSKILFLVVNIIMNSKCCKKLEGMFIKNNIFI